MTAGTVALDGAIARAQAGIDESHLRGVLAILASEPSPPGGERRLAEAIARHARAEHPEIAWEVDALDDRSANLIARSASGSARELAIYGHLDTSLTGESARDVGVTGVTTTSPPLRVEGREVRGFGAGVAKAPSAAGIVAFLSASRALRELAVPHRLTLLLAAGGTHRAAPEGNDGFSRGVTHALASGWRPDAVLNVKAGPRGVLREEPAAVYLRVRVRAAWDAALARRFVAPDGGLARHIGAVVEAIEAWRSGYLAAHTPQGQLAPEIAIGAIRSGTPEKPDLLPGLLEVFVYAVLLPSEDPERVARDLAAYLTPRVAALPRRPTVDVDVYASAPGGSADAASDVVRHATAAWTAAFGDTAPVTGWTGATDGAIFLARGIPTVRMGPTVTRDPKDPRIEIVALDDVMRASRAYVETAIRFFADTRSAS